MAINFTEDQLKVINMRDRNVLVSAAAGSGKTAVLVERIVKMVCDEENPVDIDRLLIVTFTNAAAAEMRERIAAGIAARLEEQPESLHIQRQSALLYNAQITTIDSFCLFLIRNHFNEIGLDPAFRVADDGEIKLLEQETLKEVREDAFDKGEKVFHDAVEFFCPGGKEQVLEKYILEMYHYAESFPWPKQWLEERRRDYGAESVKELLDTDCGRYMESHIRHMLTAARDILKKALEIAEQPAGPYMYGELLERELGKTEAVAAAESFEKLAVALSEMTFDRLPSKKDDSVDPLLREQAKDLRGEAKDIIQDIKEKYLEIPLEREVERGRACLGPVNCLIDLVLDFWERMLNKKQEKKLVSFSDMEHYALDILLEKDGPDAEGRFAVRPSRVAKEYRQYFKEIMIDEYQDSNYVQELLLSTVSGTQEGRNNRFMVGDVKQSIYKFRLAEPGIFLDKYQTYENDGEQNCRIDLSMNFRSRKEVIHTVNDIFVRIMGEETGGIAYDNAAMLYEGAKYPENTGCESELILVEKPGQEEDLSNRHQEALAVANKIKELKLYFKVTDKKTGELRPVEYRDMAILLRTNAGWDETFKQVLEEQGISVYISSKTGYFAAVEVQEVLQLLRTIDNPEQDIPLFGTLKSIFGGFTEEEIARIRAGRKKVSLYEALKAYGKDIQNGAMDQTADKQAGEKGQQDTADSSLKKKVTDFLEKLEEYRGRVVYMPIRELMESIFKEHDYMQYVTALPAGSKRRANTEMLLTKASDFEGTSFHGLFHFVRYIEQLEKYDLDFGSGDTVDENADVVRIMSIHKSKGLEFPVTFVCGLAKRFNMQDINRAMIMDMKMGLGCDYVDADRRIRCKTLRQSIMAAKLREDNLAEELRVLYVALTRAREKLIMTACISDALAKYEAGMAQHAETPAYHRFFKATNYLDMLLPVLAGTDIRVSITDSAQLQMQEQQEQVQLFVRSKQLGDAKQYADKQKLARLRESLDYTYPRRELEGLYTKTTVSELKIAAMEDKDEAAFHAFEHRETESYVPSFRRGQEEISGTVRGNAYHRIMEILDFEKVLGSVMEFALSYEQYSRDFEEEAVWRELLDFMEEMKKQLRLSEQFYNAIRPAKVLRFLRSKSAYRMWGAMRRGELYREQPFVYGVEASVLHENMPPGEKVLIQGIIDVFFVEEGEIVLLDYKTDVVDDMDKLWERYGTQMDYYEAALQGCMEKKVKEKILYSFYLETDEK
ncbi:MAG: helicase-exonuclease AddAB subunit AddA [Lachnospiraceae bacterium]|nr:helicase-exonuclease AddAB subunit AddA [Lachnospiraceae bacterium]